MTSLMKVFAVRGTEIALINVLIDCYIVPMIMGGEEKASISKASFFSISKSTDSETPSQHSKQFRSQPFL